MMEGGRSDGGTDGGEESGGAGHSFRPRAAVFVGKRSFVFVGAPLHCRSLPHPHPRYSCRCHPWHPSHQKTQCDASSASSDI